MMQVQGIRLTKNEVRKRTEINSASYWIPSFTDTLYKNVDNIIYIMCTYCYTFYFLYFVIAIYIYFS